MTAISTAISGLIGLVCIGLLVMLAAGIMSIIGFWVWHWTAGYFLGYADLGYWWALGLGLVLTMIARGTR